MHLTRRLLSRWWHLLLHTQVHCGSESFEFCTIKVWFKRFLGYWMIPFRKQYCLHDRASCGLPNTLHSLILLYFVFSCLHWHTFMIFRFKCMFTIILGRESFVGFLKAYRRNYAENYNCNLSTSTLQAIWAWLESTGLDTICQHVGFRELNNCSNCSRMGGIWPYRT